MFGSSLLDRRRVLVGLAAASCASCLGCAPLGRRVAAAVPDGPITLGWRWLPGATWTWRLVVRRVNDGTTTSRAEEWSYVVQDVDESGVATLRGHLTGFGAGVQHGDTPVPDPALAGARTTEEQRVDRVVTLRLRMDGRLVEVRAGDFADALPHRLLALGLPAGAVDRSAEWPLPDLVRTFATLLPSSVDVQSRATGSLLDVHRVEDGIDAEIETVGEVRSPGGPAIHLSGSATWDTVRGGLARRDLLARFTPSAPDPSRNPGTLRILIERAHTG